MSVRRRVSLADLPGEIRRIVRERMAQDREIVRTRILPDVAAQMEAYAVDETVARDKADRGRFAAGWSSRPTADGAQVGNDAPHAPIVEYGRRPNRGMPRRSRGLIESWVRRRMEGGSFAPDDGETIEQAVQRITFFVRRKIAREGTEPTPILRDAVDQIPGWLDDAIDEHLRRRR